MGRHWARQQARHDEVQEAVRSAAGWMERNRQLSGIIAGAALLALLFGGGTLYSIHARTNAAWDKLAAAQALAYGGFADRAEKEISDLLAQSGGTDPGAYALLFAGDVLYYPRAQYKEALEAYQKLLDRGEPKALQPLALAGLGMTQEAAGRCQEAVGTHQRFLDAFPEHFMAPQVHSSLARCLAVIGQPDQSKAAYQKIALQYPDTPWAVRAQRKVKGL